MKRSPGGKPSQKKVSNAQQSVLRAVRRLYLSKPPVVRFTMTRCVGGVYKCLPHSPAVYREEWMTDILNAYARLRRVIIKEIAQ